MHRFILTGLILVLALSRGVRADAPALQPGKSTIDDVLDALQASGKDLKSFTADVAMKIEDEVMSTSSTQIGKAWFQTKPGGEPKIHLVFDQKKAGDKIVPQKRQEFLLDDGWLTSRDENKKHETRIQLVPAGQKMNLFQLGKGPFPLPIGQDKKDVYAQFEVKMMPAGKNDPANSIHLQLTPKPGTPLDQNFSTIDAWIDCATRMPTRMATENKKHTEIKTTDLLNLVFNPTIKPEDLQLPPLPEKWTTIDKPLSR